VDDICTRKSPPERLVVSCVVQRAAAFSAFWLRWMDARAHLFAAYGLRHALFGRCVHLRHGF
jgi:hypothetical protein